MSQLNTPPGHPWYRAARQTLVLRESNARLWHSFLYMANIGIPALIGLSMHNPRAGIVGAITGLMLSLSDSEGPLIERLYFLARATMMLLVFGFLGHSFGGYNAEFWVAFTALTAATGWLSIRGNSHAGPLRYGALALVSTAGLPGANLTTVFMVVVAALTCTVTRAIGSYRFPGAGHVTPGAVIIEAEGGLTALRYCLVYAATVAIGLLLGQLGGLERPVWIATTTLLVMQPDTRASYQRIVQRVFGTFVGVLFATVIVGLFHSIWFLTGAVLLIAFMVPQGTSRNYWLHSALTALLILVLYDFAVSGHGFDLHLLAERVQDVLAGCLLALVGTVLALGITGKANRETPV